MNWREKVLDFEQIGNPGEGLKGLVFDVQKFAIHDGGGIRTLIFLKGCPLHCLWCSNPESLATKPEIIVVANKCIGCNKCLEVCPVDALHYGGDDGDRGLMIDRERCTLCGQCAKHCYAGAINILGRYLSVPELLQIVERDRQFYDESRGGVTFSGGEPLAQPEFLSAALKELHQQGIHTAIETSSFQVWQTYAEVLEHVDLVLTDIKHMDDDQHKKLTGVSNKPILDNLCRISELGIPLKIRLPLIPGMNDSAENLEATADFVQQLSNVQSLDILPYHRLGEIKWAQLGLSYPLGDQETHSVEEIEDLTRCFRDRGINVTIGG